MSLAGLEEQIESARSILRAARRLVAFSGAGISTPSGIPDFRSKGSGLWERDDPLQTASLTTFRTNPTRFWNWKRPLMLQAWNAQPNPAHRALARMEADGLLKTVITQNIDGLHQRAGSRHVLELHGSIETMTCPLCRRHFKSIDFKPVLEEGGIPLCPAGHAVLKPDVVLFEETLPPAVWRQAEEEAGLADVVLVAGSSLSVYPAAYLPEAAAARGSRLIIANFTPTHLDGLAAVLLPGDVAEILPALLD